MEIGKLEEVALREVWRHEERGFSAWLVNNLDALSNIVGVNLVEAQREVRAGSFEVDLLNQCPRSGLSENSPAIYRWESNNKHCSPARDG